MSGKLQNEKSLPLYHSVITGMGESSVTGLVTGMAECVVISMGESFFFELALECTVCNCGVDVAIHSRRRRKGLYVFEKSHVGHLNATVSSYGTPSNLPSPFFPPWAQTPRPQTSFALLSCTPMS